MTTKKKSFEGVGLPEQAKNQTPTEFFIGANQEATKEEQTQASIYIRPIAVNCITNIPTPILSDKDSQELRENDLSYDIETFTTEFYNGNYTDLPIIQSKEDLEAFYNNKKVSLGSYTLKASKELLDAFKVLAMIKKTTTKDLIINAMSDYLKANEEDYKKAKAFLESYLK